jgi:hypothetical protein
MYTLKQGKMLSSTAFEAAPETEAPMRTSVRLGGHLSAGPDISADAGWGYFRGKTGMLAARAP